MTNNYPAFPYTTTNDGYTNTGISLMDYFAGQALPALIIPGHTDPKDAAFLAYEYAEAMLKEGAVRV
jgi:hypothetical protein